MQREIPDGMALVYPAGGQDVRLVYRNGCGRLRSHATPVPGHLRGPLALVSAVRIHHLRRGSEIEVPILAPAHHINDGAWLGQVSTALRGDGRPDAVRIERMPVIAK